MRFYSFTVDSADAILDSLSEKQDDDDRRRRMNSLFSEAFCAAIELYNGSDKKSYCFISDIGGAPLRVRGAVLIADDERNEKDIVVPFLRELRIPDGKLTVDEITIDSFFKYLREAYRADYIRDDDEAAGRFSLDVLRSRSSRDYWTDDIVSAPGDMDELFARSRKLSLTGTLDPELERICAGKRVGGAKGHPVHYMICVDDDDTRSRISDLLAGALFANGRIRSRRLSRIDFRHSDSCPSAKWLNLFFESCEGGMAAFDLRLADDPEESDFADSFNEIAETLCGRVRAYRNRVLSVFCLPRSCEKEKKILFEELGDVAVIEIKEDLLDAGAARGCLESFARDAGVDADEALFAKLGSDKTYLPGELREMFDEWYDGVLRTAVYPQYERFAVSVRDIAKEAPKGSAFDELREMVGLSEAKSVIGKAVDYYKLQRLYKDKGVKQDRPAMHMVFTGNPGTAKTTAARLFARIMRENGLLSRGHLVEVGRSDLVGKYVGWTAPTVKARFKEAKGGVLFIDEAYSLVEDREGLYGDEAINTIVQEMENMREDLVVIFAGYPDEMETFLDKNPGLRSRIAFHVPFADYSADELCRIAAMIGKQKGVSFTGAAVQKLRIVFEAARQQPDFGNGRYARNVVEQAKMAMASRLLKTDLTAVTKEALTTIEAADIELPAVKTIPRPIPIGFCA